MKYLIFKIVCAAFLLGCSAPPRANQPAGEWKPVNQPSTTQE